jgi:quinol monooxygenase YgiN
MSKLAVLAKLTCKEGSRDAAVAVLQNQVAAVAGESGTEIYALHVDNSDDVTIWFYELYVDKDALAFHGATEAMKALGPNIAPHLAGRPELTMLTPIAAKGLNV